MLRKYFYFIFLIATTASAQQKIDLYKGAAPGSENWDWPEKEMKADIGTIVMDVSHPTLTAFVPANPNGTAVIIAPGGAFHVLAFDLEGTEVAKHLNAKGITAFVLKYRVVHTDPAHPENGIGNLMATKNYKKLDSIITPIIPLSIQDGLTAVKYVRDHASDFKIDPSKIGFMGFSAGGTVTMGVVYNATNENRPNFVAPIYAYEKPVLDGTVPSVQTPIFIAAATDDDLGLASNSVHIYSKWMDAGQPAELHMFEKGRHGFGMKKQNLPVDNWIERFDEWMQIHDLEKK